MHYLLFCFLLHSLLNRQSKKQPSLLLFAGHYHGTLQVMWRGSEHLQGGEPCFLVSAMRIRTARSIIVLWNNHCTMHIIWCLMSHLFTSILRHLTIWLSFSVLSVYFSAVSVCGTFPISSRTEVTLFEMQITAWSFVELSFWLNWESFGCTSVLVYFYQSLQELLSVLCNFFFFFFTGDYQNGLKAFSQMAWVLLSIQPQLQ